MTLASASPPIVLRSRFRLGLLLKPEAQAKVRHRTAVRGIDSVRRSFVASDFVRGLKCRLCGQTYPKEPLNFCTEDFGPLEVDYDYDAIAESLSRTKVELRPNTMWRFRELL